MYISTSKKEKGGLSLLSSTLACILLLLGMILADSRPVYALPLPNVHALPAFARKYGLPCSACHEAWPKLNNFGQTFKDNGYQLGNDRDSPIWQQPAYWPVTFRITPNWHRESANRVAVDTATAGVQTEEQISTHGFDLSGLDFHTAGTLSNNISFYVLPSSDATASFHFESVWARFDNLLGKSWLNVKMGKFELDNVVSEKRILTLSANGGSYQIYHFLPVSETSAALAANQVARRFGIGDNQLGVELMGHSKNDYTRFSIALLSGSDGGVNLPANRGYNTYLTFSQAFEAGSLGLQRVGAYTFIGEAPTYFLTSTPAGGLPSPILGTGTGNKSFYRAGFYGLWYLKKLDFTTFFMHGAESAFLGTGTPANQPLPAGARGPTWNAAFIEPHYAVNPQLIFINRYEFIRMSRQAFPGNPSNLGNIDALTFGYRYYPFMTSRDGFALHNEYSILRQRGISPLNGLDLTSSSLLFGFDFAF